MFEVAETVLKGCLSMLTWCLKVKGFKGRAKCSHGVENNARVTKGCLKVCKVCLKIVKCAQRVVMCEKCLKSA